MALLHDRIGVIIETRICPDHLEKPIATVVDGNITLECCCTNFEVDCYLKIIGMLRSDLEKAKQELSEKEDVEEH
jgi:hypothetical protein